MIKPAVLIGIDPGQQGGIAVMYAEDPHCQKPDVFKMPPTEGGQVALLKALKCAGTVAYIENVGFHMKGNKAGASVTFAHHMGVLHGALTALNIRQLRPTPSKWMKWFLGTLPNDKDLETRKKKRKNAIKAKAEQLYPHLAEITKPWGIPKWGSDALGILTYAHSQDS